MNPSTCPVSPRTQRSAGCCWPGYPTRGVPGRQQHRTSPGPATWMDPGPASEPPTGLLLQSQFPPNLPILDESVRFTKVEGTGSAAGGGLGGPTLGLGRTTWPLGRAFFRSPAAPKPRLAACLPCLRNRAMWLRCLPLCFSHPEIQRFRL